VVEIDRAIKDLSSDDATVEQLIKLALKKLGK
jgi:hypothetical protein